GLPFTGRLSTGTALAGAGSALAAGVMTLVVGLVVAAGVVAAGAGGGAGGGSGRSLSAPRSTTVDSGINGFCALGCSATGSGFGGGATGRRVGVGATPIFGSGRPLPLAAAGVAVFLSSSVALLDLLRSGTLLLTPLAGI